MQSLGSRLSQMCPARLPPPPQGSQGAQAVCWRLGAGRRLPAGSSLHGRDVPLGQQGWRTTKHGPCPPTSRPTPLRFPCYPARLGRFLLGPTAPVRPVWEVAWAGRWRRDPVEPLPRGRAAEAQTFPYVVALQAAAGAGRRPGAAGHALVMVTTLVSEAGPCPMGSQPHRMD